MHGYRIPDSRTARMKEVFILKSPSQSNALYLQCNARIAQAPRTDCSQLILSPVTWRASLLWLNCDMVVLMCICFRTLHAPPNTSHTDHSHLHIAHTTTTSIDLTNVHCQTQFTVERQRQRNIILWLCHNFCFLCPTERRHLQETVTDAALHNPCLFRGARGVGMSNQLNCFVPHKNGRWPTRGGATRVMARRTKMKRWQLRQKC